MEIVSNKKKRVKRKLIVFLVPLMDNKFMMTNWFSC